MTTGKYISIVLFALIAAVITACSTAAALGGSRHRDRLGRWQGDNPAGVRSDDRPALRP